MNAARIRWAPAVILSLLAMSAPARALAAEEAPVKQVLTARFGAEVDRTTKANVCSVESGDPCQPAQRSSVPGGFNNPVGVAVDSASASPETGDVYISEQLNARVQVLSSTGAFVLMFGWDVNKTKTQAAAPQAERNICTAASKDICQAGAEGGAAGQLSSPLSLASDPETGNVYVQERAKFRVQEFTPDGEFVLMIGKEVNQTADATPGTTAAEKNLCTAASKDTCGAGQAASAGSTEAGAFNFAEEADVLAAGGPEDLLYVGDEGRIQEFAPSGVFKREISLTSDFSQPESKVHALAVDAAGDLYVVYAAHQATSLIREFGPAAQELKQVELHPRASEFELNIYALASGPGGRLAVSEAETSTLHGWTHRGALYEVGSTGLHLLTEFTGEALAGEGGASALAFDGTSGDLYAAEASGQEVLAFHPLPVGQLLATPSDCEAGPDDGSDATVACTLHGEVNPWSVPETEVFFQSGATIAFGSTSGTQKVSSSGSTRLPVSAALAEDLPPNDTVFYRLAGFDQNVKQPETPLSSETTSLTTPTVPPRVIGAPSASYLGPFSAVLWGELNPENDGTSYAFEYAACEGPLETCGSSRSNSTSSSSGAYGQVGATLEAVGLQPETGYRYRLVATNEHGETDVGPEGAFMTSPASVPTAQTGAATAIGSTQAMISGTVDPDGASASYTFELGIYNPAGTQYGVVASGPAGSGAGPVAQTLALTGLQPGTTYAYRIAVKAGTNTIPGETATFTTVGLPSALLVPVPLAQLAVPNITFPASTAPNESPRLTNAQKLAKALRACKKKPKHQQATCRRRAHKKYPTSKQASNSKKG